MTAVTGYTMEEINRLGWFRALYPDPEASKHALDELNGRRAGDDITSEEQVITAKDGTEKVVLLSTSAIEAQDDGDEYLMILQTVSGQSRISLAESDGSWKKAVDALRRSEDKFYQAFHASPEAITITTVEDGRLLDASEGYLRLIGFSRAEAIGRTANEIGHWVDLGERGRFLQKLRKHGAVHNMEVKLRNSKGAVGIILMSAELIDLHGEQCVLASFRDITARKRAEEALNKERQKVQLLCDNAPFGLAVIDREGNYTYLNPKFKELFGYDLADVPSGRAWFHRAFPNPDYRHKVIATWVRDLEDAKPGQKRPRTFTVACRDGAQKLINFIPVQLETGENLVCYEDFTERQQAEEEKEKLQTQLVQAQKMEAIGRLAGGVAHDFNNLLTVITGYCELSLMSLGAGDPLRKAIEEIKEAGERAVMLTHQLLAFSRRQILEPKTVDLNAVLRNMHKMLQRLIGEDIELVTILARELGMVKVDPGQMEQMVMNLAINSRDAMPQGGTLVLETENVVVKEAGASVTAGIPEGPYVCLSVIDTGMGIPAEAREKIFEPFFTTKQRGKRTGLGLSVVHGIVHQSGGYIEVDSEPGYGTRFRIYFPRTALNGEEPGLEPAKHAPPRGSETVLVVEDNGAVRNLVSHMLETQGYRVLQAAGGEEAIPLCRTLNEPLHLLLTDVVMPRMSGHELAEHLLRAFPAMRALFMSGYPGEANVPNGELTAGIGYIQKPFNLEGLAKQVREILDRPER